MNCKLYIFIRCLVEKTYVSRNVYLDFQFNYVYSLEIRALQRNPTLILQTCCRYYDKWTANCMSSFVILSKKLTFHEMSTLIFSSIMCIHSKFARFKETLPWFFKRVVDTTINELQIVCLHSLSCRKNLRFTRCLLVFCGIIVEITEITNSCSDPSLNGSWDTWKSRIHVVIRL